MGQRVAWIGGWTESGRGKWDRRWPGLEAAGTEGGTEGGRDRRWDRVWPGQKVGQSVAGTLWTTADASTSLFHSLPWRLDKLKICIFLGVVCSTLKDPSSPSTPSPPDGLTTLAFDQTVTAST